MLLLIDNYDSFTYNLLHYLRELGAEVEVVRNDAMTVDEIQARGVKGVVISPGPGRPEDAGICPALIREAGATLPILGVCLGHQCIAEVFGGSVVRGERPMHGKVSEVYHNGEGVFAGLLSPLPQTRYHSLVVAHEGLPECLHVTAWTEDQVIMGLQHTSYPLHGVQFHPESIASAEGHGILKNFLEML